MNEKRKKLIALMAGIVATALALLIVYLTINDIINGIVLSWMAGFNIVLIAAILVWCGLDLEKK
jgi:high-affinity Fe2+/Pb2+ permease